MNKEFIKINNTIFKKNLIEKVYIREIRKYENEIQTIPITDKSFWGKEKTREVEVNIRVFHHSEYLVCLCKKNEHWGEDLGTFTKIEEAQKMLNDILKELNK